jgi:hypothetical protein
MAMNEMASLLAFSLTEGKVLHERDGSSEKKTNHVQKACHEAITS